MDAKTFYVDVLKISDENLLNQLLAISQVTAMHKGQVVQKRGEMAEEISFLLHGVVRGWRFNPAGEEMTICFCHLCGDVIQADGDLQAAPSGTMVCETPCEVLQLPRQELLRLVTASPELALLFNRYMSYYLDYHYRLHIALCENDAQGRYQWFLQNFPGVIDQVPHKYVASFLNMHPVHLSRLRKNVPTPPPPERTGYIQLPQLPQ